MATRPEGRRISPLYIVLGVVVVVAIVALVLTNLGGDEPLVAPTPTSRPIQRVATPAPTPEATEVFEIFEGRDPFRPLVVAGSGGAGGASPAPGSSPAPSPTDGAPVTRTPTPPRNGVQVEVLSVAQDSSSATVRVGSTVHNDARPGQTLSSGVVVDSIEGRCVNFHRGSDRFRLCEGEQVLK